MGGPRIPFVPERTDFPDTKAGFPGRLPDANKDATHIRDVFTTRMGFSDREIVALVGGGHAIGRCHRDRSGFDGPWTKTPLQITTAFFKELFDENNNWKERKWDGPA